MSMECINFAKDVEIFVIFSLFKRKKVQSVKVEDIKKKGNQ